MNICIDIQIITDYRERPSGIPDLLDKNKINQIIKTLPAGDYLINDQILVERKTAEDFIQSLIQKRLFVQCSKLKSSKYHPLFIIEGNPYNTRHSINQQAIRGALVSISAQWQIPIIYSQGTQDTFEMLLMIKDQMKTKDIPLFKKGIKPKRLRNSQLFFLQGIPTIGSTIARRLMDHFGSLICILNAPKEQLSEIKGIGIEKAKKIRAFLDAENTC